MLKGHGANTHAYSDILADFSSNVSWVDYSDVLGPIISRNIEQLKTYPDVEYNQFREGLAQFHGLESENFMVTNGAVSGIYQCAQAFANARSHLFHPEFAEYESALEMFGHQISYSAFGSLDEVPRDSEFVMFGNPNNPTGELISKDRIRAILTETRDRTVVVDEAYMEFVSRSESMIDEVNEHSNLIVIKSFTKRYSIPGLRLGYLVAQKPMIEHLNRWTQPWSVNALAAMVGVEILRHSEKFRFNLGDYLAEKQRFYEALCLIPQLRVTESESNYFLIELQASTAKELQAYLVESHQLLIRDASNFRGLDEQFIRIAVRGRLDNDWLLVALNRFFEKGVNDE